MNIDQRPLAPSPYEGLDVPTFTLSSRRANARVGDRRGRIPFPGPHVARLPRGHGELHADLL